MDDGTVGVVDVEGTSLSLSLGCRDLHSRGKKPKYIHDSFLSIKSIGEF